MRTRSKAVGTLISLIILAAVLTWFLGFGPLKSKWHEATQPLQNANVNSVNPARVEDGGRPEDASNREDAQEFLGPNAVRIIDDLGVAIPGALLKYYKGTELRDGYQSAQRYDDEALRRFDEQLLLETVAADEKGISNLAEGCSRLSVSAPGYVPRLLLRDELQPSRSIELTRTASATVSLGAQDGFPAEYISGFPLHLGVDFNAKWPNPDWAVPAGHPSNDGFGHNFSVGDSGKSPVLCELIPGLRYWIVARKDAGIQARIEAFFELVPGESRVIELKIPEDIWLHGYVHDANGLPVAGAKVKIVRHTQAGGVRVQEAVGGALTNESGEFLFCPLKELLPGGDPAPVSLLVIAEFRPATGRCDLALGAVRIASRSCYTVEPLRFGQGGTLAGWVRDRASGGVLADFPLSLKYADLWSLQVNTDETGYFCVAGLPKEIAGKPARIRVYHYHEGYEGLNFPTQDTPYLPQDALEGSPVELTFPRKAQLTVRMRVTGGSQVAPTWLAVLQDDRAASAPNFGTVNGKGAEETRVFSDPVSFYLVCDGYASECYTFNSREAAPPGMLNIHLLPGFEVTLDPLPVEHTFEYVWIENAKKQKLTRDWSEKARADHEYKWVMPTGQELFLVAQSEDTRKLRRIRLGIGASGAKIRIRADELLHAPVD